MAYAHSRNDRGERHDLVAHLRAVAALTAEFADPLGAKLAGYWLGLWHDVGKFDPEWQAYLLASEAGERRHTVDHKAAGTKIAVERRDFGVLGLLIQGHHGGLRRAKPDLQTWLAEMGIKPGALKAIELARAAIYGGAGGGAGLQPPVRAAED